MSLLLFFAEQTSVINEFVVCLLACLFAAQTSVISQFVVVLVCLFFVIVCLLHRPL